MIVVVAVADRVRMRCAAVSVRKAVPVQVGVVADNRVGRRERGAGYHNGKRS